MSVYISGMMKKKKDKEKFIQLEIELLQPLTSNQAERLQSFTHITGSDNKNQIRLTLSPHN